MVLAKTSEQICDEMFGGDLKEYDSFLVPTDSSKKEGTPETPMRPSSPDTTKRSVHRDVSAFSQSESFNSFSSPPPKYNTLLHNDGGELDEHLGNGKRRSDISGPNDIEENSQEAGYLKEIQYWKDKCFLLAEKLKKAEENNTKLTETLKNEVQKREHHEKHLPDYSKSKENLDVSAQESRSVEAYRLLEKKIVEQNTEIQRLLEQRVALESKLAAYRINPKLRKELGFHVDDVMGEIQDMTTQEIAGKHEINAEGINSVTFIKDKDRPNDLPHRQDAKNRDGADKDGEKKQKRRGWFSLSHSKNHSKTKSTQELSLSTDKPILKTGAPPPMEHQESQPELETLIDDTLHSRNTTEYDRMKEIENVELKDELEQLKSFNALLRNELEELKNQFLVYVENTKSLDQLMDNHIPIPLSLESLSDHSQLMIDIQQRALEKLSLRNRKLCKILTHPRSAKEKMSSEPGNSTISELTGKLEDYQNSLKNEREATIKLKEEIEKKNEIIKLLKMDVKHLQKVQQEESERACKSSKNLKQELDKYISLSGDLVSKTASMQSQLFKERRSHLQDAMVHEGEMRALRNNRASRFPVIPPFQRTHSIQCPNTSNNVPDYSSRGKSNSTADCIDGVDKNAVASNLFPTTSRIDTVLVHDVKTVNHVSSYSAKTSPSRKMNDDYAKHLDKPMSSLTNNAPLFLEKEELGFYIYDTVPPTSVAQLAPIASSELIQWALRPSSNPAQKPTITGGDRQDQETSPHTKKTFAQPNQKRQTQPLLPHRVPRSSQSTSTLYNDSTAINSLGNCGRRLDSNNQTEQFGEGRSSTQKHTGVVKFLTKNATPTAPDIPTLHPASTASHIATLPVTSTPITDATFRRDDEEDSLRRSVDLTKDVSGTSNLRRTELVDDLFGS